MLENMFRALMERQTKKVGNVGNKYFKEFEALEERKTKVDLQIENEIKLAAEKVRKKFDKKNLQIFMKNKEIWSRIFDELGIEGEERETEHFIDKETGDVLKVDTLDLSEMALKRMENERKAKNNKK